MNKGQLWSIIRSALVSNRELLKATVEAPSAEHESIKLDTLARRIADRIGIGRDFPIQSKLIKSIPWEMIAPHEYRAISNHCDQDLQRLAERGGLSAYEALRVLKNERLGGISFVMPQDRAQRDAAEKADAAELTAMVDTWKKENSHVDAGNFS